MKKLQEFRNGDKVEINEFKDKLPDPPMVLILKRKAIRLFPSGEKVALYHSDKLGLDVSIPYSPFNNKHNLATAGVAVENTIIESQHDEMFGDYTEALKKHYEAGSKHTDHPELSKLKAKLINKYGKDAHTHLHTAAEHYLNGDVAKAARHYAKFERKIDEVYEEYVDVDYIEEASIHKIHHIAKTKQDGEVTFPNGASHKVSAKQAAHLVRMHSMLTPENKATIEKHMNSPEGMKKVADFAAENLK
jgi:hypothetical protein